MAVVKYNAYICRGDDFDRCGYSVVFPDFPGCTTCGKTLDECLNRAHEALALHLEGMKEDGEELPLSAFDARDTSFDEDYKEDIVGVLTIQVALVS